MSVPFFSLDLNLSELIRIIKSILYPFNKDLSKLRLEKMLEERFDGKKVCLLPSARLGFYLTLRNLFKKGDELIFSSMSFPLYIKIAKQLELKVRLVDVFNDDLNINYTLIEKNINNNTKGIVATHLFGNPCEIEEIKKIGDKFNLKIIEDCAQSFDSYYNGKETGNFGDVGIFSTSLLKIPTSLSGGILITKDNDLKEKVDFWMKNNLKNNFKYDLKLFLKVFLSILNSIPTIYSIISDKIFNSLKKFNPRVYRKILYSGMGMKSDHFNPLERNDLKKYQIEIGISQIKKSNEMLKKRIINSNMIIDELKYLDKVELIKPHNKAVGNFQYFVIKVKENQKVFFNKLFGLGIHAMEENVWDCTDYNFEIENTYDKYSITKKNNVKLIRIQNNSYLKKKTIQNIIQKIKKALNEL